MQLYYEEMLHIFLIQLRQTINLHYHLDLCPVGALTSKPYAFTARPWELRYIILYIFFVFITVWTLYMFLQCSWHQYWLHLSTINVYACVLWGSSQTKILTKAMSEKKTTFAFFYKQILIFKFKFFFLTSTCTSGCLLLATARI